MWQVAHDSTDVTRSSCAGGGCTPRVSLGAAKGRRAVLGRGGALHLHASSGSVCTRHNNPWCRRSDPQHHRSRLWHCRALYVALDTQALIPHTRTMASCIQAAALHTQPTATRGRAMASQLWLPANPNRAPAHRAGAAGLPMAPRGRVKLPAQWLLQQGQPQNCPALPPVSTERDAVLQGRSSRG